MLDDVSSIQGSSTMLLTLQELLACILLEECFMCNRAGEIVNHKLEDRLNLSLIVTSIVSQGSILRYL